MERILLKLRSLCHLREKSEWKSSWKIFKRLSAQLREHLIVEWVLGVVLPLNTDPKKALKVILDVACMGVCQKLCKTFFFSLFLRLKAGVADTAGSWDTRYVYIYIYIYIYLYLKRCFPFVNLFLLVDLVDLPFYTRSFIWNFPQYHNPLNNSHSTPREISSGDISSQRSFTSHFPASVTFLHHFSRQPLFTYDLGEL